MLLKLPILIVFAYGPICSVLPELSIPPTRGIDTLGSEGTSKILNPGLDVSIFVISNIGVSVELDVIVLNPGLYELNEDILNSPAVTKLELLNIDKLLTLIL